MRIRYVNTTDDVLALGKFTAEGWPGYRAFVGWLSAVYFLAPLAAIVAMGLWEGRWGGAPLAAVVALIIVWVAATQTGRISDRITRHSIENFGSATVLCEHTLDVTPEGLRERTALGEGFHSWAGIARVAETSDYVYVFTQAQAAHMIPKGRILDGDLPAFLEALRGYVRTTAEGRARL